MGCEPRAFLFQVGLITLSVIYQLIFFEAPLFGVTLFFSIPFNGKICFYVGQWIDQVVIGIARFISVAMKVEPKELFTI